MERLTLKDIAKGVNGRLFNIEDGDKVVSAISTDTRKITEGSLFIAIKGDNFDGHSFAKKAVEEGAVAVLSQMEIDGVESIICENTRTGLLDLAGYYRDKLDAKVVGITGSVGKTTTKEFTALALSSQLNTLKTEGNLNNEIGLPTTLFRMDNSTEVAVIEMGMSAFGEIDRLSKCAKPDVCVITNIGFCHMEQLGSQENILKAKLEILNGSKENAPLIVNGDDSFLVKLKDSINDRAVFTFGIDNSDCDYTAVNIKLDGDETTFEIQSKNWDEAIPVRLPCLGRHNVYNALCGVAVGEILGISPENAIKKYEEYQPAGMRQKILKYGDITVIADCYNASPTSMKASIDMLCEYPAKGRRGAVLGDMLELGEMSPQLHEEVGRYAAEKGLDFIACYGKNAAYIAKAADENGLHSGCTDDPEMLCFWLKQEIADGDTILFKGSRGMKLEKIIDMLWENC